MIGTPCIDWDEIEVSLHPHNSGMGRALAGERFSNRMEDFDLWFVSSGKAVLEFSDGIKVPMRRGVVVFFRPGDVVESYSLPGEEIAEVHYFHFDLLHKSDQKRLTRGAVELKRFPRHCEVVEVLLFEACCRRINALRQSEVWRGQFAASARKQASLLFHSLLVEFEMSGHLQESGRISGLDLEHFRQVSELLSKIYEAPEKFQNVADIARNCGYSSDHYTKIVKSVTGRHLKRIIIDARMERVKQRLLYSTSPLEIIAQDLGYSDVYYFLRQFKEETGRTPSEFRGGVHSGQ